ncbi:nucleotidyltransferase domain-containing protein [Cysteiniphilum sp. JM-1]|uniref:nucleotidyltransferase domain-containing protein n=1 Tax=Cysteiniphilum sp. JM-1 TaxID=2610891 RepID=UPI0012457F67|nr:nucleotidyltransferase domain-containing protein [Cysteiniphilum sp. JM-1]
MRLSERMKSVLKKAVSQSFGEVPVYLFGSRANDSLSGGDIDLAIDVEMDKEQFWQCKVKFKTALLQMSFDQTEVDVVPYHSKDKLLSDEIYRTAVRLF